jgi:hypothetical protein
MICIEENVKKIEKKINSYKYPVVFDKFKENPSYYDVANAILSANNKKSYIKTPQGLKYQCDFGRSRSIIDYCRIMQYYFPEVSVKTHLQILNELHETKKIRIYYCGDIKKKVMKYYYYLNNENFIKDIIKKYVL